MDDCKLKSVRVTKDNEDIFYYYIRNNFAEYFFFHVDYAQYPENTKIFMALDGEEKVQGMVLIWKDRRIQLRGSIRGLIFLLSGKNYEPVSVTGFNNHRKLISKFFPAYKKEIALYRMTMKNGEQKDFEKYNFQKLNEINRIEIVSLMRIADPIFWGLRQPEDILIDENNIWYGISENNVLVSIISVWNYENIGYLTIVGTHPDYWRQGYASSLLSSVLNEVFQEKEQCVIMVRVANIPAINAYKKVGFSICNTHYSYERL
jgi:RimJ/RimL family protein N-acetyltransferase